MCCVTRITTCTSIILCVCEMWEETEVALRWMQLYVDADADAPLRGGEDSRELGARVEDWIG